MSTDATYRQPAMFTHCETVYNELLKRAVPDDASDSFVYTGFLTKLFQDVRLSSPYFSKVMRALTEMDCTRQLRRGGGGSTSTWMLIQPPTPSLYEVYANSASTQTTRRGGSDSQQQQVRDLNARVGKLEAIVTQLVRINQKAALTDLTDPQEEENGT